MREDLKRILVMILEGKLEVDKGADLIEAMYKKEEKEIEIEGMDNYDRRMLKVYVDSVAGDNVRINLPVAVITGILKATGKLPIKNDIEGLDFEMISQAIIAALENEMLGEIVTVDSSNGDKVRVVVE